MPALNIPTAWKRANLDGLRRILENWEWEYIVLAELATSEEDYTQRARVLDAQKEWLKNRVKEMEILP